MKHSLAPVWSIANATIVEVEEWLRQKGKSVRLKLPLESQAMLIRLQVWSIRYSLGVNEILDLVMPVLLGQVKRKKASYGLGISVSGLVTDRTEEILRQEIKKQYPEDEHVAIHKAREQEKQIYLEQLEELEGLPPKNGFVEVQPNSDGEIDAQAYEDFVAKYIAQVNATKQNYKKRASAKWRRRKHYRGNPWLGI